MGVAEEVREAERRFIDAGEKVGAVLAQAQAAGAGWCIGREFEKTAEREGSRECIHFVDTGASYSFAEVSKLTDRIAATALARGLKAGDVVSLYLSNRPELFFLWLGLSKVGIVSALINFNLTGRPLVHSIRVSGSSAVIVGHDVSHALDGTAKAALADMGLTWYSTGGFIPGMTDLDAAVRQQAQPARNDIHHRSSNLKGTDTLVLIYTSGTTGHPKAAIMTHLRYMAVGTSYGYSFEVSPADRIYCALPLYHAAGGVIGVGLMVVKGATLVVRGKFSTRAFWRDVREQRCTVIQYIGELCRYLLQAHHKAGTDVNLTPTRDWSGIRMAIGNGLSPDIWEEFQRTFHVRQIGEFYGATESICGMKNQTGKPGSVGFIPMSVMKDPAFGTRLIRYNVEEEEVVRGSDGFCIECEAGEVGQLVGKIQPELHMKTFVGYTDKSASAKKVLHNVFEKGDQYFASGDLLRRDAHGFFSFVDRIGDTFRWKGENVSTGEVGMVLNDVPGVEEANVYGVKVPHQDGRAGMAALSVDEGKFSMAALYAAVEKELPAYARPVFLRILPDMELTSTFKLKKHTLRQEGFDVTRVKDRLFIRDTAAAAYVPLTEARFRQIVAGGTRSRL
mmetsp:Transcript_853/g.3117  ORF Transcript_853/g.3117 Transcript_853/m.3117 type:complete len:619 (+) Transcript_853:53-1909(+)